MAIKALQKPDRNLRILRRVRRLAISNHDDYFKLEQIVKLVSVAMNVDICSVYSVRKGSIFLLSTTEKLDGRSSDYKKWHISEGLIGNVIRTRVFFQTLLDKNQSGVFLKKQRPEDPLRTFLGIPMVQGEKVIGVLVLKTKEARVFSQLEVELLEVVSIVIHALVKKLGKALEKETPKVKCKGETKKGSPLFRGELFSGEKPVHGKVLVYGGVIPSFQPLSSITPEEEIREFRGVIEVMQQSIEELKKRWTYQHKDVIESDKAGVPEDIFNAYMMLLDDPSWRQRVEDYICKGFTACAAVLNVQQDMDLHFSKMQSKMSSWMVEDFADITQKIVFLLKNMETSEKKEKNREDFILVAKNLGPGDLLTLKDYNIRGLVLEEGGPSSHVVLLAQSLKIPALCWVEDVAKEVKDTDYILLDVDKKVAVVNPTEQHLLEVEKKASAKEKTAVVSTTTLQSKCHEKGYEVLVNIGLLQEIEQIQNLYVDGVGLMRTEILFMQSSDLPSIAEQERDYSYIIKSLNGCRCCIRTLDIGSDKKLPYVNFSFEENPALGWRSIRRSLDKLTFFRHQLRALIRSSSQYGPIDIIFPFIATAEEFFSCKEIYQEEVRTLKLDKKPSIRLGVMIEVPSIIEELEKLKGEVDFFSIGTNDLYQFFFACDRNNPNTSSRYSTLNYSFLKMLKNIYEKVKDLGLDITVCGDMASNEKGAEALAAIGYRKFSVPPSKASLIQKKLLEINEGAVKKKMNNFLAGEKSLYSSSFAI